MGLIYKTPMSNRYLTHFSMILVGHALLLFGSWQMAQQSVAPQVLNVGPSVLKMQVVSQIIRPLAMPEKKVQPSPLPKKKTPTPAVEQEVVPVAASSAMSPEAKADLLTLYKAELRAKIEENKYYPPASRRLGQTGVVVVAFTLLEDGHIIDVRIDTPSVYERLNESALDAVKKVHGFRPIPKELEMSKMDIKVPVKFFTI